MNLSADGNSANFSAERDGYFGKNLIEGWAGRPRPTLFFGLHAPLQTNVESLASVLASGVNGLVSLSRIRSDKFNPLVV